ncbi:MAG TPA: phosphotyrosine protein phosphatase, partial [Pseudomonas sp.]|nr:phosphotyrosine protein phosphatase [Pseudomonas sp.]
LFMSYAPSLPAEVPDPYFGGDEGFEQVLDMLEAASAGLLDEAHNGC